MWPCNNYFLHCQGIKLCIGYFFSNWVWSHLKYQASIILLVQNVARKLKDRKKELDIISISECRCNLKDYRLFWNNWKLLEILWLFSGQSKKIPDYEQTGSSDHCFRGHRISPVKRLKPALLEVSKIYML